MEGKGFEAHLANYLRSLREAPGGGIPLFGPGGSTTCPSLPAFPTQLPYLDFTEQRRYQIRHAPTPEAMTFSSCANEEVSFFFHHLFYLSKYLSAMMFTLFFFSDGFCSDGYS